MSIRSRLRALLCIMLAAAACRPAFQIRNHPTAEGLYQAGLREFQKENWDNAVLAFEKLTIELPARDTLLPRSHWYLGHAHAKKKEHLLAAQSWTRLTESFPDDTLADDALYHAGRSYAKLWRRPDLDPQYGHTALSTFRTLLALYPNSGLKDHAEREIARLEEWMADKDYRTGIYYLKTRKLYEPAILYFREVIRNYPNTEKARESWARVAEAYRAMRYREDLRETCESALELYPADRSLRSVCPDVAPPVRTDTVSRIPE